MRERMERWVTLPFTMGCASQSRIAVTTDVQSEKHKTQQKSDATRRQGKEKISPGLKVKKPRNFIALAKSCSSHGIMHRLMRSLKSFSQIFVCEEEMEEVEMQMEIGSPTDVKHVTHIGWDGSTTTNPVKGWENLMPHEILAFPTISFRQFDHAMAAQADAPLGVSRSRFS